MVHPIIIHNDTIIEDTTTSGSTALVANVALLAVSTLLCFEKWCSDSLEVAGIQCMPHKPPASIGSSPLC